MSEEQVFTRQLMGRFPKDPNLKMLNRVFNELPKGSYSQAIVYRGVQAIRNSSTDSVEIVEQVLAALASTCNELLKNNEKLLRMEGPSIVKLEGKI